MSHICPGPGCSTSILDYRWACLHCYARLSREAKQAISQRFTGSAENHIAAVAYAIAELRKSHRKTTTERTPA